MHEEAQACMGTCAEGCLAKLKLSCGIHGVHVLTTQITSPGSFSGP